MTALLLTAGVTIAVVTVGMLIYMSFMSADRNGWRRLARTYRADAPFRGETFHFRTAVLNGFAFHGILVVGVSEHGLMLRPVWLLRAFHPALLLPWSELTAVPFERTHHRGVRVELRDSDDFVLEWSETTHLLVAAHLPVS